MKTFIFLLSVVAGGIWGSATVLYINRPADKLELSYPKPPGLPFPIYIGATEVQYEPCAGPTLAVGWGYDQFGRPEIQGIRYVCHLGRELY